MTITFSQTQVSEWFSLLSKYALQLHHDDRITTAVFIETIKSLDDIEDTLLAAHTMNPGKT